MLMSGRLPAGLRSQASFTSLNKDHVVNFVGRPDIDLRVAMVLHEKGGAIAHDPNTQEMDRSIKPGDDFYRYANGGWLKTTRYPPARAIYDNRAHVDRENEQAGTGSHSGRGCGESVKGSVGAKSRRLLRQLHG